MSIKLANSPCSWGVDYADAASNPHWKKVTKEIVEAGYNYSELGPYGYMPTNIEEIKLHIDSINLKINCVLICFKIYAHNYTSKMT